MPHAGVPHFDAPWGADVLDWWGTHPFNPDADEYDTDIRSSTNFVIYPGADNLEACVNALPESGGTIAVPPGTYSRFEIIGKSHVHIRAERASEKASVILRGFDCLASEDVRSYTDFMTALRSLDADAVALVANKPRDIYVRDVTIDGDGSAPTEDDEMPSGTPAFFRTYRDVVFDNVRFTNFAAMDDWHPGLLNGNILNDNVWALNCQFEASVTDARYEYAMFFDGLHVGGMVGCTIGKAFSQGGALFLTNEDFTVDLDGDGNFEDDEVRNASYVVIANNTPLGDIPKLVQFHGRQCLVKDNVSTGWIPTLVELYNRCAYLNNATGFFYRHLGTVVTGNVVDDCQRLLNVNESSENVNCMAPPYSIVGQYTLTDNAVTTGGNFVEVVNETGDVQGPNTVSGNTVAGSPA